MADLKVQVRVKNPANTPVLKVELHLVDGTPAAAPVLETIPAKMKPFQHKFMGIAANRWYIVSVLYTEAGVTKAKIHKARFKR